MKKLRDHIKVVFKIFARDMKRLVHNPIACLIVIGACILPSLYAWYTIAAFWDPYQNTDEIKVAVADKDIGATSELTGEINIGKEVVEDLSQNHQLGWQIVDEQDAMNGVYSGQYYAAIILPENFSSSFLGILDGRFERPQIDFYVNDELTASGVKVAEAGASALEKQINQEFVDSVSKKVIAKIQDTDLESITDTKEASGSLTKGVKDADDAINSTIDTLKGLIPTINNASSAVSDGENALNQIKQDLPGLETRLDETRQQLGRVRDSLNTYANTVANDVSKASVDIGASSTQASQAASQISAKLEKVEGSFSAAIDEAKRVSALNSSLLSELKSQQAAGMSGLTDAISNLEQENTALSATLSSLGQLNEAITKSTSVTDTAIQRISNSVASSSDAMKNASANISGDVAPKLDSSLDDMSDAIGVIKGALVSLEPVIDECISVNQSMQDTLKRSKSICKSTRRTLRGIETDLNESLTDLRALQKSATYKLLTTYLNVSDDKLASFLAEPVEMHTNDIFPVSNYGSGVAPFFTNLALWVAGFILMAIVRIRVDPADLPKFTRVEAYFGRWLTYAVLGIIQGIIVAVGDLVIGVSCVSLAAFILASALTAFVYVNLMYALAYSMRHLGKAIAVFVLILQIPGSSGMFPIEMIPSFYQVLNPMLPFTYSIDAMREALAGFYKLDYLYDMLMLLLVFVPVGFAVGLVLGKYGYNLNILFDRKLGSTELFTSEGSGNLKPAFRLKTMVKALLNTSQYREFIIERAKKFDRNYKKLARIGWIALFVMPVAMIVCISIFNGSPDIKLIMLAWFFLGLLLVAGYLICISFLNSDIEYQMSLAKKSDAGLKKAIDQSSNGCELVKSMADVTDSAVTLNGGTS